MTTKTTTSKSGAGRLGLILIACTCVCSCTQQAEVLLIQGKAQGTTYHISFVPPAKTSAEITDALSQEIELELARLDKSISNYRTDSDIELFNSQITTEPLAVSTEIIDLIEIARQVNKASLGCYDLTIKPLFDLWGFKKHEFTPPNPETLAATLSLVGMDKLETLDKTHLRKTIPNLRIDLSSIGQGYSISKIAALLEARQITQYIVEIGGELKARGKKPNGKPWRIALEKPLSSEQKIETIAVFNSLEPMAMMPSGTYHNYFDANGKRYSHILDARTGKPIEHTSASATVLNADPTLADAWSTALLCLGSAAGIPIANAHGIAALYIDEAGAEFVEKPTQPLQDKAPVTFERNKTADK